MWEYLAPGDNSINYSSGVNYNQQQMDFAQFNRFLEAIRDLLQAP